MLVRGEERHRESSIMISLMILADPEERKIRVMVWLFLKEEKSA